MTRPSVELQQELAGGILDIDQVADQQLDIAIDCGTVIELGHETPD